MKASSGYCLEPRGDAVAVVGARAAGDGYWRLDGPHLVPADKRPGAALARALAADPGLVLGLVPDDRVQTAVTTLPRLKSGDLKRAVLGWVARETSRSVEDSAVAWRALTGRAALPNGVPGQNVFMLHADRADLRKELDRVRPWGVQPGGMLPGFVALDELYRLVEPETGSMRAWNLVFVGGAGNFLCVATRESLLLTRPLPRDLSDGGRPEEYLERLATEVDRSVFFARQTEGSPEVERLVVCGEPGLAVGLVERLSRDSSIPAVHWDLARHFDVGQGTLTPDLMVPAAAAALATTQLRFNLLGGRRRLPFGPRARRRFQVGVAAAVAALMPILLVGGVVTSRVQTRYLDRAHTRMDEARQRAEAAAEVYDRQRILVEREDHIRRHSATDRDLEGVLSHLAADTPPEVVYSDLQILDRGAGVVLHLDGESAAPAIADAQRAFMTFQEALARSPILHPRGEPRRLEIVERDVKGSERKKVEFSLVYEIVPRPGTEEGSR